MPPTRLTTAAPPVLPTASLTLRTGRNPTPAADITVPAGQAAFGALAVGLLVGAVGFAGDWPLLTVAKLAAPAVALAFGGLLLWRVAEVTETLTERVETFIGHDLNGGGIGVSPERPDLAVKRLAPGLPYSAAERQSAELWDFLMWSYGNHGKTSLEAVTAAGILTEDAWARCRRRLVAAGVTEDTRAGTTAGWRLTPETVEACWYKALQVPAET